MGKIMLMTTGGTFLAKDQGHGLAPGIGAMELLDNQVIKGIESQIELMEVFQIDSSNMQPENWLTLGEKIVECIDDYDGVVVIHGTDTMAYTASILSYMLQDLKKPIVLTGSQIPLNRPGSDAPRNLELALMTVEAGIMGVSIAFCDHVIRGCRASKVKTLGFNAFKSISYPDLAVLKSNGLTLNPILEKEKNLYIKATRTKACKASLALCSDVFVFKTVPGLDPRIIDALCQTSIRGMVIEAFGVGCVPIMKRSIVDAIERAISRGIVVVAKSQCHEEPCDFSVYETGKRLLECGIITAKDMTTEGAVTKLMWALANTDSVEEVKKAFSRNYCGEMTVSEEYYK